MKNWQPTSTITTIGWENYKQPAEINHLPPVRSRVPGLHIIICQNHTTTLLEYFPPPKINPTNGSLFDVLPTHVLAAINNWIIGLE